MADDKQDVSFVAFVIQDTLWHLEALKNAAKEDSFFDRLGDPFLKLYFVTRLFLAKRKLGVLLNSSWKTADPKKFLAAGNMLFQVNEFKLAKLCFEHSSASLKDDQDQDTRLLSLMGRLECVIAVGRQEFDKGTTDGERNYSDAKERYDVIFADLDSLSPAVGLEISFRLRRAFVDMHTNLRDFHERNRAQSGITQPS